MTLREEQEMHVLAQKLERLTRDPPFEAGRYLAISLVMEQLATYCAVCDCQRVTSEAVNLGAPSARK